MTTLMRLVATDPIISLYVAAVFLFLSLISLGLYRKRDWMTPLTCFLWFFYWFYETKIIGPNSHLAIRLDLLLIYPVLFLAGFFGILWFVSQSVDFGFKNASEGIRPKLKAAKIGFFILSIAVLLGILRDLDSTGRIIERLKVGNASQVEEALGDLANRGPAAKEAVPALLDFLENGRFYIFSDAAYTLSRVDLETAKAQAPHWMDVLQKGDNDQQRKALEILGGLGPEAASDAIPLIRTKLRDPELILRIRAVEALASLGTGKPEIRSEVEALTHDSDPEVAAAAKGKLILMR